MARPLVLFEISPVASAYPTATNLSTFLTAAGFSTAFVAALDTTTNAAAGYQAIEKQCRRTFLAGSSAARLFDPPTGREGILFIPDLATATTPTITYTPSGSTATTLTASDDYWLEPYHASSESLPYTRVRFLKRWLQPVESTLRRSLSITGQWGWGTTFPDEVWLAMLQQGALGLMGSLQFRTTRGRSMWVEAGITEQFAGTAWTGLSGAWETNVKRVIGAYRRHDR